MKDKIMTLGIESSCDETAAAVVLNGRKLLSNIISTQIPVHQKYGGVVPEIASRKHITSIMPVIHEALCEANITLSDIDEIAATYGPGLQGALLVGLSAAKALAFAADKPFIGVNHLEGHIFANFLSEPNLEPPFLSLVVSGGHTSLVEVADYNKFSLMGETRDDAAGEAFDKVARVMGLPYPGGPEIDKIAKNGDPMAIDFPKALRNNGEYDFSFSGLKSAVLNYLNQKKLKHEEINKADVAASFQEAVVEILTEKAMNAMEQRRMNTLVLAGGVAANSALGQKLSKEAARRNYRYVSPTNTLCTDNAAMIACRGFYQAKEGYYSDLYLNAEPGLSLKTINC